ncbi:porin family protein [Xanthovirga aplysinae]|uniref:porin family protein n=1 Tax=Xanthovirga aplysinae TaxID=2529853 RepID=UPI0012BD4135|nr:porin family protein [Xanthovirga aplysinae]MTI31953.1 PorT family protein [Xanthovirga aplysinae]
MRGGQKEKNKREKPKIFSRNIVITLLLSFTFFGQVKAQFWSIGPRVGLNMTQWSSWDHVGPTVLKNKNSLNTGLLLLYFFSEKITFQGEINYSQSRALGIIEDNQLYPNVSQDTNGKFNLTYLEIPLIFRYDFGERGKVYISAGLNNRYLLFSYHETHTIFKSNSFYANIKDLNLINKENLHEYNLSFIMGGGIDLPVLGNHLIIDFRLSKSLINLIKTELAKSRTDTYADIYLNLITISIGYAINI